jgi:hypothetical protein
MVIFIRMLMDSVGGHDLTTLATLLMTLKRRKMMRESP